MTASRWMVVYRVTPTDKMAVDSGGGFWDYFPTRKVPWDYCRGGKVGYDWYEDTDRGGSLINHSLLPLLKQVSWR